MTDLYEKIVSERGSLESLVAKIPGFRGYQEGAARRQADTMIRDHVAKEVDEVVKRFARIESKILDNGGLSHMAKTREVKSKIQMYRDRIKTSAPKYSGLFAQVKVTNDDLETIYAFDEAQLRYVDRLNEAVDGLDNAVKTNVGLEDQLAVVEELAAEANEAYGLRDDVLLQLDQK